MSDDAPHFPLSALDDYPIHQTTDPIRLVATSDFRAYERYWTVVHMLSGELVMAIGGSFYANLDAAESYAIVNLEGDHRSVRGFRPLGTDRTDMTVGPIRPTIVEGLRTWRHQLAPNEAGITYDLTFTDTFRQEFRERRSHAGTAWPAGRRPDVTSGFEGFGTIAGWVEVDGRRIALTPDNARGTRDRHWGVGRDVGGPALQLSGAPPTHGMSGNAFVAFEDWGLWGDSILYPLGSAHPRANRIVRISRRLRFEPDTHVFLEGIVDYDLATGGTKRLHFTRVANQTVYMRCGMYGGTPDTALYQGMRVGDHVETDRYDVSAAETRRHLAGLDEHLCVVTCDSESTVGVFQPIDPFAYEACAAGRSGWGLL